MKIFKLTICGLLYFVIATECATFGQDLTARQPNHDLRETGAWLASPDSDFQLDAANETVCCEPANGATATEFPTVKLTGFFHLDAAFYSQDALNELTLGDIDDGLGFRRARLAAKGAVAEDVSYIIEFDIAQSQARFVDVWMQLDETRFGKVRLGRFRQPFGMSELTSVRELPFLEPPVDVCTKSVSSNGCDVV